MPKRTEYGEENLEKIEEFRKFLLAASKEELEALIKENSEYFYKTFPYAYALEISD